MHLMAFSKCCVDGDGVGKDTLFYYKNFFILFYVILKMCYFFHTPEKNFFS